MNKIFIYYRYLMHKTFCSWRMLAVIIVTILTMDTFMASIRTYCKDTGEMLSQWGFVLIWDNKYVGLCFMLIYIFAVSNFPENREKERYFISRMGISTWISAQAFFLITFGWLYASFLWVIQNLLIRDVLIFINDWGSGWKSLVNIDITSYYNIYITIPGRVISNYSPQKANILIFIIMGLLLGMIGMLVLWMNLYGKMAGSLAASTVTLMSMAAQRYIHLYKYSPVNWLQLDNHYSIVNPERPSLLYIILMLLLLTALFFMMARNRANHTQENNRRKL